MSFNSLKCGFNRLSRTRNITRMDISLLYGLVKRSIFQCSVAKNMTLISNDEIKVEKRHGKVALVKCKEERRPLVVLFLWIYAEPRVIRKYVDVYLKMDHDVMTVRTVPWHAIFPTIGTQVTVNNVLDFINDNIVYQQVLVHAMSIGGFVWSEALVKMYSDLEKHRDIVGRFKGQIFEALPAPPPLLIPTLRHALAIKNDILAFLIQNSISLYFKMNPKFFAHIMKCSQIYNGAPLKIPTLLLLSKSDLVSPFQYHMDAFDRWKSHGIQAHAKLWEHAPHIGILKTCRQEYLHQIHDFMNAIGFFIPQNK